jgi:methyl-accepting chemotaxis protein
MNAAEMNNKGQAIRQQIASMADKTVRQKYFVSKELRISIALIILWTLLVTAFFTYIAREIGGRIGHGVPLFIITMFGYAAIVVGLTMLFSHRLIGPFQRLKTEIRLILNGDYRRRLNVRKNDDIYIRSFIVHVNRILDEIEDVHQCQNEMIKQFDSELLNLIAVIEEKDQSREKLREAVLALHRKLRALQRVRNR